MRFYAFARATVGALCRLIFRVRVRGKDRFPATGACIVAPSHRSILDVPFMSAVTHRRIRFMAKQELFQPRFGRWLFDHLGAIEVDRGSTDRAALRVCQAALEAGEPVAIFPEGTRGSGPVLGDLFDGVAYLALKLDVPIVPLGIGGSEEILASGRVMPRLHRVSIVVGEPIVPPPPSGERRSRKRSEVTKVTEELQARLQACFDEARSAAGDDDSTVVGERGQHV